MAKRQDEEYAKEAFRRWLAHCGIAQAWQDGAEPPDYFLDIRGIRFGVEITQVMEDIDVGSHLTSYQGMSQSLARLTERLEERARSSGVLNGTFVLGYAPIRNLRAEEPAITASLLKYLAQVDDHALDLWTPILHGLNGPVVEIMKVSDTGASLGEMIGTEPKWGGQIVEQGSRLIVSALASKAARLSGITGKHILLLVDAYHYAGLEVWCASIAGVPLFALRFIRLSVLARSFAARCCTLMSRRREPPPNYRLQLAGAAE